MASKYSTQGRAIGDELPAIGMDAEALAVEADIAERIADESGADEGRVARIFYAVTRQAGRKIARRMVEIEVSGIGDNGQQQATRFLAQRCEPDGGEPWYTVGALKACAVCKGEMLMLAGSWGEGEEFRAKSVDPDHVLNQRTPGGSSGKVAHVGCGPIPEEVPA